MKQAKTGKTKVPFLWVVLLEESFEVEDHPLATSAQRLFGVFQSEQNAKQMIATVKLNHPEYRNDEFHIFKCQLDSCLVLDG